MGAVPVDQRAPVGALAVGAKLGRYEILAKLAAGGMAIVYVGRVQGVAGFERLVALKVLHANLAHEDEFIGMFLDEARLAASIRHPNVVPTIDISDSDEAGYFIVMEYIEGDHLGALLSSAHKAEERLPISIALRIVADALGGLGAAHDLCDDTGKRLNLVHRDVSPHNIMVGRDGVVRLTDFGVAKAEDRLTHTRDGQVKGKLAYMAPEQAASGQTDSRSDLFSMGVILWECVTGRRLFRAENTAQTLHKLLHDEIAKPSSIDPLLAPIDALLGKALARNPSERFQTAEEFAQAIEEVAPALGGLASLRGVARNAKHYTAAKLKREKKLIDDAIRQLRPAGAPDISPELDVETTSPSASDISVTTESHSASKVSGVFSHDTIPGARRISVRRRPEEGPAAPTGGSVAPTATTTASPDRADAGRASGHALVIGTGVAREAPLLASTTLASRSWLRYPVAWATLAAALLVVVAYTFLLRPRGPQPMRVSLPAAAALPEPPAAPSMSTVENSPAVAPTPELPTESLAPTAGVIPTATPAATTIADAADMKLPLPAAPTPATSLPVAPLPITTMTTPARAERSARVVSARRDEAPTPRQQRRVHKERERVEVPAPRVVLPRDEPRSDVIPNPYHD